MVNMDVVDRDLHQVSDSMFLFEGDYVTAEGYSIPRYGPQPTYAKCDELNEGVPQLLEGGVHGESHRVNPAYRYPSTGLESIRVYWSDGVVFEEVGHEKVVVSDPWVIEKVESFRREDRETLKAREDLARELASEWDDLPMALTLFRTAIWFARGNPGEAYVKGENVSFWQAGRNASHEFYMGMRRDEDGIRFFKGYYECPWEDREGNQQGGWDHHEVEVFGGYFGHC